MAKISNFKQNNCSFYSGTKALAESNISNYSKHYIWRLRIPFEENNNSRNYISKMLNAIVGIEISITHLQGKWKTSQNQPRENQDGVIAALRTNSRNNSSAMADLIEARAK